MWKGLLFIVVSLTGTIALSFAGRLLLGAIRKLLYLDEGGAIDRSHHAVRTYGTQTSTGVASKREVYEHYHGQFTWYERHDGVLSVLTLLAVAASSALPAVVGFNAFNPSRTTIWVVLALAGLGSLFIYFAWDEWFLFSRREPRPYEMAAKGDVKGLVGIVLSENHRLRADVTILVDWRRIQAEFPGRFKKEVMTLSRTLENPSLEFHVRAAAAKILGRLGDDAFVPALREAASTDIRDAAIAALAEVGTPAARAALEPIADELVAKLEGLTKNFGDEEWKTATHAARALGFTLTRNPKAGAVLEKLAEKAGSTYSQHSSWAEDAAKEAIGRLRVAAQQETGPDERRPD